MTLYNCTSSDGIYWYDFSIGWVFTYDVINVSPVDQYSNYKGSYCYSTNY